MPDTPEIRDAIDGDSAFVEFMDDTGAMLRIECQKIPAELPAFCTGPSAHQDMDFLFDRELMPKEFKVVSPDTTIEARDFVKTAGGDTLFVVVNIPGGSTVAIACPAAPARLSSGRTHFPRKRLHLFCQQSGMARRSGHHEANHAPASGTTATRIG